MINIQMEILKVLLYAIVIAILKWQIQLNQIYKCNLQIHLRLQKIKYVRIKKIIWILKWLRLIHIYNLIQWLQNQKAKIQKCKVKLR